MEATNTKGSKTDELVSEIKKVKEELRIALAENEGLEDKIVSIEASRERLREKRSDLLTEDVVLAFIARKSKEYDPGKVVRGERCGQGVLRSICHLYNNLTAQVEQAIKENAKK